MLPDSSEAEHLAEICDYDFNDYEPYSALEKQFYLKARSHCFSKEDIGKYVIVHKIQEGIEMSCQRCILLIEPRPNACGGLLRLFMLWCLRVSLLLNIKLRGISIIRQE